MHSVEALSVYTMSELLLWNYIAIVPATIFGANLLKVNEHSESSRGVKSTCQSVYLRALESKYTKCWWYTRFQSVSHMTSSIRQFDTEYEARNRFSCAFRGWGCVTDLDNTLMESEHLLGIHCLQAKYFLNNDYIKSMLTVIVVFCLSICCSNQSLFADSQKIFNLQTCCLCRSCFGDLLLFSQGLPL